MEKIHGSSSHISWKDNKLNFFSGGEKHETFIKIFNQEELAMKFTELGVSSAIVNGEVYGGKCQGMSATYGKEMKFVAFDVRIDEKWLSVPQADDFVKSLGLEFVDYVKISTDLTAIDAARDADSVQAVRNGCGEGKKREGVVLRPLIELTKNNGARIIAKHKRDEFRERTTPQKVVDLATLKILSDAKEISEEWTTSMRLTHVLDKLGNPTEISQIGNVIKAMVADIEREAADEIVFNKAVAKAIGTKTVELFKERFCKL
ncbi:MAG: RNA ligase family protein [Sulfurimonas sp.]